MQDRQRKRFTKGKKYVGAQSPVSVLCVGGVALAKGVVLESSVHLVYDRLWLGSPSEGAGGFQWRGWQVGGWEQVILLTFSNTLKVHLLAIAVPYYRHRH